jgi:uncharacterized protein YceK
MNRILPFLLVLLASGCATVYTRTSLSGNQPNGLYPATRADVGGSIRYCRNQFDPVGGWRGAGGSHRPTVLEKALWVTFATVDLPISLVTDTVCFPWDVAETAKVRKAPVPDTAGTGAK